jgi:CxxC-x17-CxxC domain-containing protein
LEYRDKKLTCVDCEKPFVWIASEQLFYADRGFKNEPKRCRECKSKKFAGAGGRARISTAAVCSQCGKQTIVPFEPKHGRPVFCADCFKQRRQSLGTVRRAR